MKEEKERTQGGQKEGGEEKGGKEKGEAGEEEGKKKEKVYIFMMPLLLKINKSIFKNMNITNTLIFSTFLSFLPTDWNQTLSISTFKC